MKFAKELDEAAVPEWKSKYLDYKKGKKKLKAVQRAIRAVESRSATRLADRNSPFTSLRDAPVRNLLRKSPAPFNGNSQSSNAPLRLVRSRSEAVSHPSTLAPDVEQGAGDATPRAIPVRVNERSPLRVNREARMTRYGSIIGSPPRPSEESGSTHHTLHPASTLDLPMPSLDPEVPKDNQPRDLADDPDYDRPVSPTSRVPPPPAFATTMDGTTDGNAPQLQHVISSNSKGAENLPTHGPTRARASAALPSRLKNLLARQPQRSASTSDVRPLATRLFSIANLRSIRDDPSGQDIPLEEHRDLDFKKAEFFLFLDKELVKIEDFYKEKEDESTDRLDVLRSQLHMLRDQRVDEVKIKETLKANGHRHVSTVTNVGQGRIGKTSRYMANLATPILPSLDVDEGHRSTAQQDYVRREYHVTYRAAKRKLKLACQELYRGLELLKSYSLLNRTAYRKINKKYNKSIVASTTDDDKRATLLSDYMSEKVNMAHFVLSDVPDKLIQDIEDLYARYFERGNRKLAVNKLRAKNAKASDYGGPMYRAGLLQGIGFSLIIVGLVYAGLTYYGAPVGSRKRTETSYLLEVYGGYFCFLLLSFLFIIDAWIFERYHVNYSFIFELNNRTSMNWRQVSEIPSVFACMLGICMVANFSEMASDAMYLYWPVVLVGVCILSFVCNADDTDRRYYVLMLTQLSVFLLFAPIPKFFYSGSRFWLAETLGRLLCSGFRTVEFRDFFIGDMFCSQTYAMGNIELFFCLYAHGWNNPDQCNSGRSRLLGFFSALPGVWRALQCAKRYLDSRNAYPHLANMGKYGFTILQYTTLSMWRINKQSFQLQGLFIACATINSIYCIFWDIANDWSLSPQLLRRQLAYKKHKWWYYAAMVEDTILRFLWLGYVIFPNDLQLQHSSIISFVIAVLEILRRGIWVIFRVENEHSTNVVNHRAIKQTDLPYPLPADAHETFTRPDQVVERMDDMAEIPPEASTTSSQLEQQTPGVQSIRRRQMQDSPVAWALKNVGSTILTAHSQDYERRKPVAEEEEAGSDDDDDEDSDRDE